LGIESEQKFIGKGVSSCGTCDAPFFKGKNVIVAGGGDTAMEDSNFVAKFANSVTIVHRRGEFRASKIMQERVLSNPKIKVLYNTTVEEILGEAKVTGVKLRNVNTNEETAMPIDGVFIAIGYAPNTSFLVGKLKLDEQGYIVTNEEVKTDIDGVFVAGDVSDRKYRQAITAAGSGAKAAIEVRGYILGLGKS
jgi:thioredoxin reductase (NADPH)